jgi:predicted RNase H-like HicB family nuclease
MQTLSLTAIIGRDGDGYVALCPEVDVASQGESVEGAQANLQEALELFFEAASPDEVQSRLRATTHRADARDAAPSATTA